MLLLHLPSRGGRYKLCVDMEHLQGIFITQNVQPLRIFWLEEQSSAIVVVWYSKTCEGEISEMDGFNEFSRNRKSHSLVVSSFWLKKIEERQLGDAEAVKAILKVQNNVVVPLQCDNWFDVIVA